MSAPPSLREVFARLNIPMPEGQPAGLEDSKAELPWFMRLFLGGAAWVAVCIFDISAFQLGEVSFSGTGIMFLAAAVCISRFLPRNVFLGQFALAFSMAGRIYLYLSILIHFSDYETIWNKPTYLALVLLLIEVVLFLLYDDATHRFISTLICVMLIALIIWDQSHEQSMYLYLLGGGLAWALSLISPRRERVAALRLGAALTPLRYGLAVALLGVLWLPLSVDMAGGAWMAAASIGAALALVAVQIVRDVDAAAPLGLVVAAVAACTLLAIPGMHMPGILGGLLVLALGFWRSDRPLLGMGAAGLLLYLSCYYYTLEWTLLIKSMALIATGGVLLLARWGMVLVAKGESR